MPLTTHRILAGRPAGPRGAFVRPRNARVGQAIPPAKGMPRHDRDAGHHNQTSLPPRDVSADGNGRRPFATRDDGVTYVPSEPPVAERFAAPIGFTLEAGLYALILLAGVLTRFWDLGSRALHHDESLHAYFS